MTTYNTGNPIGSTDARDLYDNAQNLDTAINSASPVWVDRLGNARQTLASAAGFVIDTPWLNDTDFATLAEADAAAAAANKRLAISTVWAIASTTTLTSAIKILPGGGFSGSGAITINGPFEAGLYQVFTGSSPITFGDGAISAAYPEWWGVVGDGVTDDTSAFQKAIFSPPPCPVVLNTDVYLSDVVYFDSGLILDGNNNGIYALSTFAKMGAMLTSLKADATAYNGVQNITLKNVVFDASASSECGCLAICHAKNITITDCSFNGVTSMSHHLDLPAVDSVSIIRCKFTNTAAGTSLQIDGAETGSMGDFTYEVFNADSTRSINILINGCYFKSIVNGAIHLHKNGHKRIIIDSNTFIDCQNSLLDDDGYVGISGNAEIIFTNNNIRNNDASVLDHQGNGINLISGVTDVQITNNNFNTYYWPIIFQANADTSRIQTGVIISGNTLRSTIRGCVSAYNLYQSSISDNSLLNIALDKSGIDLSSPFEVKVSNNSIVGNGATGTASGTGGIYSINSRRLNVNSNSIKGCYHGISVGVLSAETQDMVNIHGNTVISSLGDAISVYGLATDQVQNCIISGNSINGESCPENGIVLTNGRRCSVANNSITALAANKKGIYLVNGAQCAILGNTVYGASTTGNTGIEITAVGQASVTGNILGNLQYGVIESDSSGNTIVTGNVGSGVTTDWTIGTGSSQANNISI